MIVFDVTDTASFEKVRYWLNELKEHVGSDMPALLVGNKIDLTRERTVDVATAKRFSSEVNIRLRETSAKTNEGVTEAFADLVATMLQRKIKEDALKPPRPGDKSAGGVSLAGQPTPASGSGGGCSC
jgi:GTPase SAR1 family protein